MEISPPPSGLQRVHSVRSIWSPRGTNGKARFSSRSNDVIKHHDSPYYVGLKRAFENPYDESGNPNGIIQLRFDENKCLVHFDIFVALVTKFSLGFYELQVVRGFDSRLASGAHQVFNHWSRVTNERDQYLSPIPWIIRTQSGKVLDTTGSFPFIPLFESILNQATDLGFSRSVPEKLSEMDASTEKRVEAEKNTSNNFQSEYDSSEDRERQSRELKAGLHPLKNKFVFWYTRRTPGVRTQTSYEDNIKQIMDFSTVEGFWVCYCHLARPSSLPSPTDLHLFKQGIRPLWEDSANCNGGKWIIRFKKAVSGRFWEDLVLALVGDQLDYSDNICGIVLSVRFNEDILSVWNRNASDNQVVMALRDKIKRHLKLPHGYVMEYKPHDASLRDNSSYRNTWLRG
ncbi:hypothetical protein L1887_01279 [Cichorium endivia]|nr:hypothetical protein L1887_01279 [Cichorium endivia]